MLKRVRVPSHSTVVAYLALFLALAGGSFAAGALMGKKAKGSKATVRSVTVTLANPDCRTLGASQFCTYPATPVTAKCKKGEHATGGGVAGTEEGTADINSPRSFAGASTYDRPDPVKGTPTGWTVDAVGNTSNGNGSGALPPAPSITVYAVCSK